MHMRKKIKWTILGFLSLGFLLFLTLVVHIAVMVYHRRPLPFEHTQMARVDFPDALDSMQISRLKKELLSQSGVKTAYFSRQHHNVVYTFDNRLNNTQKIYNEVFGQRSDGAKRYIVSADDLKKGCPVMDNNSFYGKLTSVISKTIN